MTPSSQQPQPEKALATSPAPISPSPDQDQRTLQREGTRAAKRDENENAPLLMLTVRSILGWMTPYEQMEFLRRKRDLKRWELFRDSLMRRWSNLNVICGLIMGAVSTIVFANFPLSRASFTLGIISLLSSLIAIGFGVGLIYVLGDVRGSSLVIIDDRYPRLNLFALSIPEVWAFISFGTFFADVSVIVWEAENKGWIVKMGTTLAAVAFIVHLVAFGFLFREQDTTEFLIPDEPVFATDAPKPTASSPHAHSSSPSSHMQSQSQSQFQSQSQSRSHSQATLAPAPASPDISASSTKKGKPASLDGGTRPNMLSRSALRSSQTLVASPGAQSGQSSFRALPLPLRASTVPARFDRDAEADADADANADADVEMQRSLNTFVPRPAGDVVPSGGGN